MEVLLLAAIFLMLQIGSSRRLHTFDGLVGADYFRDLQIEGDRIHVGARDGLYRLNLDDLTQIKHLEWKPDVIEQRKCINRGYHEDTCSNYIRVLLKDSNGKLLVCGTCARKPRCRAYTVTDGGFVIESNSSGTGISPKTPDQHTTAVYAGGSVYAGGQGYSVSDYLIYKLNGQLRTIDKDSRVLNKPEFIASFEEDNYVYFMFREAAVEYINCGKRVYSRISRVCKDDKGGAVNTDLQQKFTSFFKARMNCSIPGEFPFYFDEIQSMSLVNQGNYRASADGAEKMFYAVFTTPPNSIQGSAVCAYRWSDVRKVFLGKFKSQRASTSRAWLPVPFDETPEPHPAKCNNQTLTFQTQQFVKSNSLMDEAVPSFGSGPIVMQSSLESRFTKIAVDFQVKAADGLNYDVLFIGMDDGTVRKAFNKGRGDQVETVIIEDIKVFDNMAIENIKIHKHNGNTNVIVVSSNGVKKFSVHDCSAHKTCSKCVAAQDPYCSWGGDACRHSTSGLQSLTNGIHAQCQPDPTTTVDRIDAPVTTATVPTPTCATCAPCLCPVAPKEPQQTVNSTPPAGSIDNGVLQPKPSTGDKTNVGDNGVVQPGKMGASSANEMIYSASSMAIAAVVSIVLSLFIGFIVGYRVSMCKNSQDIETPFMDRNVSLRKSQNHMQPPQFTLNDSNSNSHNNKQLNMVVNLKPKSNTNLSNGNAETKPVAKVKKVYL